MGSIKIFMYDNNTGREVPRKVGTIPVNMVLGSSVFEIHSHVEDCQLFCVFSNIADVDIVVPSTWDKEALQEALRFGKYDYKIKVMEDCIWYSDRAEKNIVISDSVDLDGKNLSTLLTIYLSQIELKKRAEGRSKAKEVFRVCNTRNGEEIIRTPSMDEAVSVCDSNPCCVVLNRNEETVYRSSFGKVAVPYKSSTHSAQHKAKFANNNGIFKFKNR